VECVDLAMLSISEPASAPAGLLGHESEMLFEPKNILHSEGALAGSLTKSIARSTHSKEAWLS
jgi:hypothetical protein